MTVLKRVICVVLLLISSAVCRSQRAELQVQTGHALPATSVVFSPDGKMLASGGLDSKIKFWDLTSGTELRTLTGHSQSIKSVVFSPDGRILASGSEDNAIKLWEVATGRELYTLSGPTDSVQSVQSLAFSPDGKVLASASWGAGITLWDVTSGRELRRLTTKFPNGFGELTSVAFSPDGKTLASGGTDGSCCNLITLWDVSSGHELRTMNWAANFVYSVAVAFSPDGKMLASGSYDTLILWDVNNLSQLRTLTGNWKWVRSVAFSPDGKMLASGSVDQRIRVWDVPSGNQLYTLNGHLDEVNSVTFSPDGKTLASASNDDTLKLWDVSSGSEVRTLKGHSFFVSSVAFSPDGRTLAFGNWDLKLWNLVGGRELRNLTAYSESRTLGEHSVMVGAVVYSPDGKMLASGNSDNTIKLWDAANGQELHTLTGHSGHIISLKFSPNGKTLASSGWFDKRILLWDVARGRELRSLVGDFNETNDLAFSPDGKILASTGLNASGLILWDVASGRQLRKLDGFFSGAPVAFSPDGKTLAVGGWYDKTLRVLDVSSGSELRSFTGHPDLVEVIAFSPDGNTLASGGKDGTIKLWDVVTGRELLTLVAQSQFFSIAFSPDGQYLVGGYSDATIKIWDIKLGKELADLIALDHHDWAVVTPSGLFDASPGARKLMHYVVGLEPIALDQMKDLYYVPGLLQKVLRRESLPKIELFSAQDLFPEAEYKQPEPGQKALTVKLHNRGGGIGPVELVVNGTQVIADARPAGVDSKAKDVTLTLDLSRVKQLVPGKENKVEVIAHNAAGSLSSKSSAKGTELVFTEEGAAPITPPELYVIVGGVADYLDERLHLLYSAKDAEDFAHALEIGATKFLGKDKVHVRLLTSKSVEKPFLTPDSSVLSAEKENFRKVFAEFAVKAKPNDLLVVYLSGHGVALKLNNNSTRPGGDTYLYLTREAYTTEPSALADEKIRTATSVSGDELLQWIQAISVSSKALVLDTCAAGAATDSLIAKRTDPEETVRVRALEHLKDTTGFFILMGSAGDKVSYEATPYHQGLLTYSLLEALKGAKLHDGGYANVGQLFGYAQDRVPVIAHNLGLSQQPRFLAPDVGSPFDVGLYTDTEQKLFDLPTPSPLILRPSLQNRDLGYDNLRLLPVVNQALLEASYVAGRGNDQSSLVFVDASEMQNAFMPSGLYTIAGNQVTLKLNLIRNEQPAIALIVEGVVTDEQTKAAFARKIVTSISAETRKLIH